MDVLRVAAIQMEHGDDVADNLARARARLHDAARAGAALAVLPEYFFAALGRDQPADVAASVRAMLQRASLDLDLAVGGNVIERREGTLRNVGVVYEGGRLAMEQEKVHPMPREAASGIAGGHALHAGTIRGRSAGILVCADILYPEAARVLSLQGAQLLLNPVMSPWREQDNAKTAREAIFVARAYDSGAFVIKAGGYRKPRELVPGQPAVGIAGRSLITAPWGILARYEDDFAEAIVTADLDFERLAEFRRHQAGFPARRPEAYAGLL